MSKSEFTKAKRFTYFHTSHTTTFDGSETQHVKSNLTASVDGDHEIKADSITLTGPVTVDGEIDLGQNKIVNVENVLRSVKKTILYSVLTATSPAQAIPLFRASPGDSIINQVAYLATPFGQNATMQRTLITIGDAGDVDGFGRSIALATPVGWQWMTQSPATKGEYLQTLTGSVLTKNYSAATLINAVFTASNMWLASFDKGQIDIYVDVLSRS